MSVPASSRCPPGWGFGLVGHSYTSGPSRRGTHEPEAAPGYMFYGCSYMFHLSGDNSRDRYIKGPWGSLLLGLSANTPTLCDLPHMGSDPTHPPARPPARPTGPGGSRRTSARRHFPHSKMLPHHESLSLSLSPPRIKATRPIFRIYPRSKKPGRYALFRAYTAATNEDIFSTQYAARSTQHAVQLRMYVLQ